MIPPEKELEGAPGRALADALRAASGPGPDPGAAARIADRAWQRRSRTAAPARTSPRWGLLLGRSGLAAAAALLVAGALISLRGTDPLLAVEGDPVRVKRAGAGDWTRTREIRSGDLVDVPAGDRTLVLRDGGRMDPAPGARFRVAGRLASLAAPVCLEFRGGAATFAGDAVSVLLADVDVVPERGPGAVRFKVSFDPSRATVERPAIEVFEGAVLLAAHSTGERLRVGSSETATALFDVHGTRLALDETWRPELLGELLLGALPVDAWDAGGGGVHVLIARDDAPRMHVSIPSEIRERAVEQIDLVAGSALRAGLVPGRTGGLWFVEGSVDVRVRIAAAGPASYLWEKDGEEVRIEVDGRGAATLTRNGEVDVYPGLGALRAAAPDVAALFGEHLR